jgi:ribose 5-phosphate isomerase A
MSEASEGKTMDEPMTEDGRRAARQAAGQAAAALVEAGMVVGLGTGDSAGWFVRALGRRVAEGLRVSRCVATSVRTAELAAELGLPLCDLDELPAGGAAIDLTVDGADEIDPALRLIKGGGGALLREKLVAHSSRRLVIVADAGKRVPRLGERFRLPVEIVPFGARQTLERMERHFPGAALRGAPGAPQRSDGGNLIVDVPLRADAGPLEAVHERLKLTLGVIETGLFLAEAEQALIGAADGSVQVVRRAP